jgi:hypothetical protein
MGTRGTAGGRALLRPISLKEAASLAVMFLLLLLLSSKGLASGSLYEFSGDLSDVSLNSSVRSFVADNDSPSLALSAPKFETQDGDDFIALDWNHYLRLPNFIEQGLDTSDAFKTNIRFKLNDSAPGFYQDINNPDVFRNIIGTHKGARNALGFNVYFEKTEDQLGYIALMVGEGSGREGYFFKIADDVAIGQWHELSLRFFLEGNNPRIDIVFDGGPSKLYLSESERVDNERLIDFFSGGNFPPGSGGLAGTPAGIFVGGFPFGDPLNQGLVLSVDNVATQLGEEQDSSRLNQILNQASSDLVSGVAVSAGNVQEFLSGFADEWDPIETNAIAFLKLYFEKKGEIFPTDTQLEVQQFAPSEKLAYFLQQWVFDNLYTKENLTKTANLPQFPDAVIYPGPVADSAPRITKTVSINGTYQTDDAYILNGQDSVLRPTGLYVPPGELVTVSIPASLSGKNWKVRIGISFFDLESTWTAYNRFPRIGNRFSLDTQVVQIANPFGGGLYIEVPDGAALGRVSIEVHGAVEMPTYAVEEHVGLNHSVDQFLRGIDEAHVPYFELIGRKFNFTHPNRFGALYSDPKAVLAKMDSAFAAIDVMTGRPPAGIRAEWLAGDRMIPVAGTAMAASYPIHGAVDVGEPSDFEEVDEFAWSPLQYLRKDYFSSDVTSGQSEQRNDAFVLWHEWGHLHNLPTLGCQEGESNVHLLYAVVANKVLGADIDTALKYSGFQQYDFEDAALDTMFSPNWQTDKRLCIDPWDNEVRYQTRSWARLVEIAKLYGWEAVGKIHNSAQENIRNGNAPNYGYPDDDFIQAASYALNINLAPVFEFWGVPVTVPLASELAALPHAEAFKERLRFYLTLVPADRDDYAKIVTRLRSTTGSVGRWDYYLANYDAVYSQIMSEKVERILSSLTVPSVSISGGDRTIADTDDSAGETVSFTATATDSDGTITTTQWLVGGSEVATGTSASLSLGDGATVVTFKATDNDGASTTITATITVEAPNVSPSVSISGGDRTIADTDDSAGETVSFTATATDSDGTIATTQWLVGGSEVATGTSASLSLGDGATVVTFKAIDDDGASSTTTATITVASPAYEPTEDWPSPYNGVTPDLSYGLEFNNVGVLNSSDSTIYVCLRIFTDGLPSSVSGISQFDMGLEVVSLSDATVQITKFREFNAIGALNENAQSPDCSGKFETTTGIYTDIIAVGDGILETTWSLIDPTNLILKLDSFKELIAN